ncbi:hypothetical protein [Hasllibacter sp. MH4015]|uniref:hypothetical protein n=1 Tax=Hasllibacter sp. MH4015 TaxID=2854029 RepID=UPI001CD53CE4|nr:hypothetical protein [Hasllibacter sp. MH4015]
MGLANDLAEQLALDACNAADKIGDETLPETIAQVVGASSPTTEELYRTAVRVIQAERRARGILEQRIKAAEAKASGGDTA